jgi:hypothetical protein
VLTPEVGRFWAASPAALVGLKAAAFGRTRFDKSKTTPKPKQASGGRRVRFCDGSMQRVNGGLRS